MWSHNFTNWYQMFVPFLTLADYKHRIEEPCNGNFLGNTSIVFCANLEGFEVSTVPKDDTTGLCSEQGSCIRGTCESFQSYQNHSLRWKGCQKKRYSHLSEFFWGRSLEKFEIWESSSSAWCRMPNCLALSSPSWINLWMSSSSDQFVSSTFLSYIEVSWPNSAVPGNSFISSATFASTTFCVENIN